MHEALQHDRPSFSATEQIRLHVTLQRFRPQYGVPRPLHAVSQQIPQLAERAQARGRDLRLGSSILPALRRRDRSRLLCMQQPLLLHQFASLQRLALASQLVVRLLLCADLQQLQHAHQRRLAQRLHRRVLRPTCREVVSVRDWSMTRRWSQYKNRANGSGKS